MGGLDFRGSGGGGGNGLTIVSNDAGRTALTPSDGTAAYQTDTKELWIWTGGTYPTGVWSLFGRVDNIDFAASTASITVAVGTNAGSPRPGEPVTLTADLNLSAVAATGGNLKVLLDIQADGLRAQMVPATDSVPGFLTAADHTALTTVINGLAAHIASTTAHSANHITVSAISGVTATDVQAALAEIYGDLQTHINNTTGAHAATAISVVASGNQTQTNAGAAINGLQTKIDTINANNTVDVTVATFGSVPNNNGQSIASQVLTMQPADGTHPGGVSTAAQVFGGTKALKDGATVGNSSAPATSTIFQVVSTTLGSIPAPVMTTSQRTGVTTPATGLKVYDSDLQQSFSYNGTNWEPERGYAVPSVVTQTTASTLTPGNYRKQVQTIKGGSSTAAAVTDVLTTNAKLGDELILVGDASISNNPVQFISATHVTLNGSCTLGANDMITLVLVTSSMWLEVSRSA